ncbi:MAG: pyridoxamine 5'-phosphate oxidase [Acidobacteriota bacterium]
METLTGHLDPGSVASEPIKQFQIWFDEAVQAQQPEPEAMALATASAEGRISNRIVLLKGCDDRGFTFFTNYESRKSSELTEDSWAALTFFWQGLHRQVRVEGRVNRVTQEESAAYFATRPRGSQLGAWASPQSKQIASRSELLKRLADIEARFQDGPVPCPPNWGGIRVSPLAVEFWQGRESRLHERVLYTRQEDGGWRISLLAP